MTKLTRRGTEQHLDAPRSTRSKYRRIGGAEKYQQWATDRSGDMRWARIDGNGGVRSGEHGGQLGQGDLARPIVNVMLPPCIHGFANGAGLASFGSGTMQHHGVDVLAVK